MPINNISTSVSVIGASVDTAWACCSFAAFDFDRKTARVVYTFYATKDGAYSGLPALKTVEINIGATPTPAVTIAELVTPGVPAVYGEDGEVATPAVDPVYSTTEVYPEIPSLPQLIAGNQAAYTALAAALDALALSLPEFAGGVVEPV